MGFSEEEQEAIRIAMDVSLSLSLTGSVFILSMYALFPDLRGFAFKLVFCMTIADAGKAICKLQVAFLLPTYGAFCYIAAVADTFCALSSVLWTSTIAWSLYITVVRGREDIESLKGYFHLYSWGIPLLITPLPFITDSYGPAQGWCWIAASKNSIWLGTMWRLIAFYGPLWLVIPFNIYSYARVIRAIRMHANSALSESVYIRDTLIRRLRFYPLVLIICYAPVTVKRIYDFIDPEESNIYLGLASACMMCLNGLLNAVVYGFTDSVKDALLQCFSPARSRSVSLLSDGAISLPRRSNSGNAHSINTRK